MIIRPTWKDYLSFEEVVIEHLILQEVVTEHLHIHNDQDEEAKHGTI